MDAANPFQPPAAELGNVTPFKLYSLVGIGLATFFGTPLAGAYLLSKNLRALGLEHEIKKAWIYACVLLGILIALGAVLPESMPSGPFVVVQVFSAHAYSKQLIGPQLLEHRGNGGTLYSNWRAAGIGLLFLLPIILAIVVPVVLLYGV